MQILSHRQPFKIRYKLGPDSVQSSSAFYFTPTVMEKNKSWEQTWPFLLSLLHLGFLLKILFLRKGLADTNKTHTHEKYSDVIKASFIISLATEDSIIWLEFTSLASLPHFSPSFFAQPTPAQTDQLFLMQAESFPLHASTPDVQPSPESPNSTPFPGLATMSALPEFSKKVLGL